MSAPGAWSLPAEPAPAPSDGLGRVVLVGGGRQGVGVSTVAGLLALVLAGEQQEVLLVEADEPGTAHRLFGASRPAGMAGGMDTLEPQPTQVLQELAVLSLGGADPGTIAHRVSLLRSRYALTVVDGGSRLRTALAVAAAGIDRLLCVTTGDAIASAGAYALLKALESRLPGLPAGVLVNRTPIWAAAEVDHHLRQAAVQFLRRDVDVVGQVPLDECLRAGVRAGMTLQEVAGGSPATVALHEVVQNLFPHPNQKSSAVFAPRPFQRRS